MRADSDESHVGRAVAALVAEAPCLDRVGINRREVVNERVIQEKEYRTMLAPTMRGRR